MVQRVATHEVGASVPTRRPAMAPRRVAGARGRWHVSEPPRRLRRPPRPLRDERTRRQAVRGAEQGRLIGLGGGHLVHDPAAEDDDRPVAHELDLLQLRGVQQDRRAGRRKVPEQLRRSGAWSGCRCRASGRSRAASGHPSRSSARSSPSAGCHRTVAAPPTGPGCRSAAAAMAPPTVRFLGAHADGTPVAGRAPRMAARCSRAPSAAAGAPPARSAGTYTRPARMASAGMAKA